MKISSQKGLGIVSKQITLSSSEIFALEFALSTATQSLRNLVIKGAAELPINVDHVRAALEHTTQPQLVAILSNDLFPFIELLDRVMLKLNDGESVVDLLSAMMRDEPDGMKRK